MEEVCEVKVFFCFSGVFRKYMVLLSSRITWSMDKTQFLELCNLAKVWQVFRRLLLGMNLTV